MRWCEDSENTEVGIGVGQLQDNQFLELSANHNLVRDKERFSPIDSRGSMVLLRPGFWAS